ncbi:hypothetical protein KSP39_PZI010574 [Platanthera zijinensis]|uniref:Uncharacterized protein n=1 Tax=Platanthera zijinensis TaxID=2320716 RepID=A0AAP0G798_9ASPA
MKYSRPSSEHSYVGHTVCDTNVSRAVSFSVFGRSMKTNEHGQYTGLSKDVSGIRHMIRVCHRAVSWSGGGSFYYCLRHMACDTDISQAVFGPPKTNLPLASEGPKEWNSIPRSKLLVENRVREQARRRGEIPWPTTVTAAVGLRSRIFNGVQVRRKPPPPAAKSPPNVSPHLNGGGGGGGRPGRWPSGREMTLEGAPGRANLGPWLFGEDERMPSILL